MMWDIEAWLREGQHTRKLVVATALEVHPFPRAQEMYQVLTTLAEATPQVTARCQTLITKSERRR